MEDTDLDYLLRKVKKLNDADSPFRRPTHYNIWAGCYDVWMCEQDRYDAIHKPKEAMKKALDAGYMVSEEITVGKYTQTVYRLTESGEAHIKSQ